MKKLSIDNIERSIPYLSKGFCSFMSECACYSLMVNAHDSGVNIDVETGNNVVTFGLEWNLKMTPPLMRSMKDMDRTTEYAAMGLALLFTLELTPYKYFEVSKKGTGIDIWLFEDEPEILDFSRASRLEISGIGVETKTNTVKGRVRIKKNQSKASDNKTETAYVSVSEFKKPQSVYIKR